MNRITSRYGLWSWILPPSGRSSCQSGRSVTPLEDPEESGLPLSKSRGCLSGHRATLRNPLPCLIGWLPSPNSGRAAASSPSNRAPFRWASLVERITGWCAKSSLLSCVERSCLHCRDEHEGAQLLACEFCLGRISVAIRGASPLHHLGRGREPEGGGRECRRHAGTPWEKPTCFRKPGG